MQYTSKFHCGTGMTEVTGLLSTLKEAKFK